MEDLIDERKFMDRVTDEEPPWDELRIRYFRYLLTSSVFWIVTIFDLQSYIFGPSRNVLNEECS